LAPAGQSGQAVTFRRRFERRGMLADALSPPSVSAKNFPV
jgi:hypothetical protein